MPYDVELAERVRLLLSGRGAGEKRMFGGLAFLADGHLAVAASRTGGLMVRVGPADHDALLLEPGTSDVEMGARGRMTGWLLVSPDVLDDDEVLRGWVERGWRHASAQPRK